MAPVKTKSKTVKPRSVTKTKSPKTKSPKKSTDVKNVEPKKAPSKSFLQKYGKRIGAGTAGVSSAALAAYLLSRQYPVKTPLLLKNVEVPQQVKDTTPKSVYSKFLSSLKEKVGGKKAYSSK